MDEPPPKKKEVNKIKKYFSFNALITVVRERSNHLTMLHVQINLL